MPPDKAHTVRGSSTSGGMTVSSPVPRWADLESSRSAISGRLSRLAQGIGWVALGVGLVVLVVGWWLGLASVASVIPGEVTMKANTAAGIGLMGLAVVGVARGWNRCVPAVAAGLVLLIGAVTVVEYMFGLPWSGLDELLAREGTAAVATAFPGRMGFNTAFDMVAMGIAAILLTVRRAPNTRQALSAVVVTVATVAALGYALQVPAMSGHIVGVATRMAINTSVLHLLLGLALLLVVTDRGWAQVFASPLAGGRIARVWTPMLLIVVTAVSVTALVAADSISGAAALGQQLGLSISVVVIATVMLILAALTNRLDQDRLREAALDVERSERLYRLGFDSSPIGIGMVGQAGDFLEVNRAFAALIGKPAQTITSRESMSTLSDPGRVSADLQILQRLFSGAEREASFETTLSAADGRSIPVQADMARVEFASETVLFSHFSDLTQEREAQRQVLEKNQDLQRSNEDLERFAYIASHDLQEPLRHITSFVQKLEEKYGGSFDERGQRYMGYVVDAAKQMRQLIDGLLEFSRVGRSSPELSPLDLGRVVDSASKAVSLLAEDRGAAVEVGGLPTVLGDEDLLFRLFVNLLANAIKFAHPDRPSHVAVTASAGEGDVVEVWVSDNGIGIEAKYRERAFEIFERLNGDKYPGTGMGLSVARRIVDAHQGSIALDETDGGGTTVRIQLRTPPAVGEREGDHR